MNVKNHTPDYNPPREINHDVELLWLPGRPSPLSAITRILAQSHNQQLQTEEALIGKFARENYIPMWSTPEKHIARGFIAPDDPQLLCVGGISFVRHALRHLGKELPELDTYPECLAHLLHRKVEKVATLNHAKRRLDQGERFFIKPQRLKRFTGFVTEDSRDPRFNGASGQTPVYISEVVKFVSEWRVYVADGTIVHMAFADHGGNRHINPNRNVVEAAVAHYTQHGAPAGYALDFGVLDTGETALVEFNDGFSLGAYGKISPEAYFAVVANRWVELTR